MTRTVKIYNDPADNSEDLPDFVNDKMNRMELVSLARDLLRKHFDHMEILIYLRGYPKNDALNFVFILHGMLIMRRMDLVAELVGLWEYYLSMQEKEAKYVAYAFFEAIKDSRFFDAVFEYLFEPCRKLSILDFQAKMNIRDLLTGSELHEISLPFNQLAYLYDIDIVSLRKLIRNDAFVKEHWAEIDERSYMNVGLFESILLAN